MRTRIAVLVVLVLGLVACGKVQGNAPDAGGDDDIDAPPDPCAAPAVCECEVATEDSDCGAHEYCEAGMAAGRTCECVAGYTRGNEDQCVFTGALQDPGFAAADVWEVANGALLNPTAVGEIDPGEASFLPSALCGLAHVKQTVEMPSLRKAEPLVLVLSYKNQADFNNFDDVDMGVSLGGGWFRLPFFTDANFHTTRICLPEGGFAPPATSGRGAPVTFAFGPFQRPSRCPNSTITNFAVDHVSVVVANPGECSGTPGEGINFDAESTGGWTFSTSGSSSSGFVTGLGVAGSRAAQITRGARCDSASMTTTFDVPAVANPMLEMFVGTNSGTSGTIVFGDGLFQMSVSMPGTTLRLCLPPSLRGQFMTMRFATSVGAGSCADIVNDQVFADNVRVIDEPACASNDQFSNAGFEHDGTPFGSFGFPARIPSSNAVVRTNPNLAHSGQRYLSLESFGRCSSSGYVMFPTVPPPAGGAGPALTFFANVGNNPNATTSVFTDGVSRALPEGGGYQKQVVCLDPAFVGRPQIVRISHNGGSGLCDNSNYPIQTALIDEIEVTTDPSCPVP